MLLPRAPCWGREGSEDKGKAGSEGELGVRVQVAGSCQHMPGFVSRIPRLINSRREPQGQPRGKNKLKIK